MTHRDPWNSFESALGMTTACPWY